MQGYIFSQQLQFEELAKSLPPHQRPTDQQIKDWNLKANQQIKDRFDPASQPKQHYAWITINAPSVQYDMKGLWDAAKDIPYKDYIISVEQYTHQGEHPHLHLLAKVNRNTRKGKEIARMQKLFGLALPTSIHIKILSCPDLAQQKRRYVCGEKTESKIEDTQKDQSLRNSLGIPRFLSIGTI